MFATKKKHDGSCTNTLGVMEWKYSIYQGDTGIMSSTVPLRPGALLEKSTGTIGRRSTL